MSENEYLSRAEELNDEFGWRCIPLEVDSKGQAKKPIDKAWNQPKIDWRSLSWEKAKNLGICTGQVSGILVVDTDTHEAEQWARKHLPITLTFKTRRGYHRYYKYNKSWQDSPPKLPLGVDIIGDKKQAAYKEQVVIDEPIGALPEIPKGKKERQRFERKNPLLESPQSGERNNWLARWGGLLAGHGLTTEDCRLLLHGLNHILENPLSDEEVKRSVNQSVVKWVEAAQPATDEFFGAFQDFPDTLTPEDYYSGWLRQGSYTILYARAGLGKTAFLADLIRHLRHGGEFLKTPITANKEPILWINGDMPAWQVNERLGFLKTHNVTLWHTQFANLLNNTEQLKERCLDHKIAIFDNRASLFPLEEINAAEAWETLNKTMRTITDTGTAIILATHAGKGEIHSAFGSSAQEWFADTTISLTRPTEKEWNKDVGDTFTSQYGEDIVTRNEAFWIDFTKARLCKTPERILVYLSGDTENGLTLTPIHQANP